MEKKSRGILINNNGDKIDDLYEGDMIVRKESIDYLKDTQVWKIEHFYKGHTAELKLVFKELNVYEKAFLFSLAIYTGYDDCCLKHDNGRILSFDDMVEITGISRSKLLETLNKLRKKDIIYKGINSDGIQYFMNPWLFCRGNRINAVLKTMFQNYKVKVMGGVRWKDLK